MSGEDPITLRDFFKAILVEQDKRYDARFAAQEVALDKAERSTRDEHTRASLNRVAIIAVGSLIVSLVSLIVALVGKR